MKIPLNSITGVIEGLLRINAVRATKYLAPNQIVRATRKNYGDIKITGRSRIEILLTIGHPNYLEREFVRDCKKSGEPFPVKKIQFKLYSPKKKALKRK